MRQKDNKNKILSIIGISSSNDFQKSLTGDNNI
jgi:hypothetical protein